MFAVIRTGGKQYRVSKGDIIKIEKLDVKVGDKVTFDDVLLVAEKDKTNRVPETPKQNKFATGQESRYTVKIGTPKVKGAKVEAKVLKQGKHKKVVIFKYKAKKRYKKKLGHRQLYTKIEITDIKS